MAQALLRVVHSAALAVASFALAVALWGWLQAHSRQTPSASELGNLAGLVGGLGLGLFLLWTSLGSKRRNVRTVLLLYLAWTVIFGWFWFSLFPLTEVRELHSLDPASFVRERTRDAAVSTVVFLLWLGLCSIGPLLKARGLNR